MATTASSQPSPTDAVEIRPVAPADRDALQAGFERLSERSRYRRFLSPHDRLTDAELRYFTEVDHHDHEALVAIDAASGEGVGIARYIRSPADPRLAELAVAVSDDWQGRGIGTGLTLALAGRARHEGIAAFTALVLSENTVMLELLAELGAVHDRHDDQGVTELTVDLPDHGLGPVSHLLRAAARREIDTRPHHLPSASEVLSMRATDPPPRPRCLQCGDVIGVYEPVVRPSDAGWRETSLAAEPELSDARPGLYHRACFAHAEQGV